VNSKYRWRPKRVLLGRVRLRRSTRPFLTSICHAWARLTRENDERILRGRLVVTQALWDHEREQILEALGVAAGENNRRAWSTDALVEEIKDCIEGQKMLASIVFKPALC
jgi:hypothetical protein